MDKLREWLELTRTPVTVLAGDIDVHPNTVHNWLEGRSVPNGIAIRRLHKRTSLPLEDLVPELDAERDQ